MNQKKLFYTSSVSFILSIALTVGFCRVANSALTDILSKYCVPKDGGGCIAGVRASYEETTGYCTCDTRTKRYNTTGRVCEECIMGSFASKDWKTCEPVNCPNGQYAKLISGNCPSGLYKKLITTTCPVGYGMMVWNYTTKLWSWR